MHIQDVIDCWNIQADEYNQWSELSGDERVEFALKFLQSQLEEFRPLLDEWRGGRPIAKICYGLSNEHMKALDRIISA